MHYDIETLIETVSQFELSVDRDEFKTIWGEEKGAYLWARYAFEYQYNIIKFWQYLDIENREILCLYFDKYLIEEAAEDIANASKV